MYWLERVLFVLLGSGVSLETVGGICHWVWRDVRPRNGVRQRDGFAGVRCESGKAARMIVVAVSCARRVRLNQAELGH